MEAEDCLKGVEKKLVITQCMDREKVLFAAHQLFGMVANWWETYCNTHTDVNTIMWNEFKTHFHTHYVPRNMVKLKKKGNKMMMQFPLHLFPCDMVISKSLVVCMNLIPPSYNITFKLNSSKLCLLCS
jgi:hypothetical protein